ncbi:EFR1 family ferrodoxin [Methanogenium cariaci]|jgi:ferredoxin
MKTVIYYFTGTGNSLAAARTVASVLGETECVPIASLRETPGDITPGAERVGIICPVYDAGIPVLVVEFAKRLNLTGTAYVFAVVTMGGVGVSALHQLNGIVKPRRGKSLDAAFAVRMPDNFPPIAKTPSHEKAASILAEADERLQTIARDISAGKMVRPGFAPVSTLFKLVTYGKFVKNVHEYDREFSVSDACTGCGICETVCPVQNITIEDGHPSWGDHCELCCACLHFCPAEAIDLNVMRGTKDRGRYRHPDLSVTDMKVQQGVREE